MTLRCEWLFEDAKAGATSHRGLCTATFVGERVIVTTAHCLNGTLRADLTMPDSMDVEVVCETRLGYREEPLRRRTYSRA